MAQTKRRGAACIDATPERTLERIASASMEIQEDALRGMQGFQPGDFEACYAKVTIADIRHRVAREMAKAGERFSSDYRHEVSREHALCYHILGSTVMMNVLCEAIDKERV